MSNAVIESHLSNIETTQLSTLKEYPGNPRIGDVAEIAASLKSNGQFQPLIVQASTRYVLAGNHTKKAAESLGWTHLDASLIDVTDPQAARIVAAANRTADLGGYNDFLLAELLQSISDTDQGLEGTGYDDSYMEELLARVEPELPTSSDEEDDDGGYEIAPGPTGAHYAETEEQEAARETRVAGERSLAAQGLAEIVIVLTVDSKAQLLTHIETMREHLGDQPTGPLLAAAVRIANTVLDAAHTNAPPVEWDQLLVQAAVRPGQDLT